MRVASAYDLLGRYPDRSRPWVTHYDGPDSRGELSVASTANAVAKAASMLRDGLGLAPGSVVSIDLPRHWQLPVWVMAALSVGATVGRDLPSRELPTPLDVRIGGPQGVAAIAAGRDPGADEVLACSCDTFGLPIAGGVPAGVIDVVEVRAHPDQFVAELDAGSTAVLLVRGVPVRWADVLQSPGPQPGARLWIDEDTAESILLHAVIEPLLVGGSVVIGTGLDAERGERIRVTEAVTGVAGR
jgi:uncharacterized protein (TIGR03089 family)